MSPHHKHFSLFVSSLLCWVLAPQRRQAPTSPKSPLCTATVARVPSWQSTVRRLGSNVWPCKRLHAIELPHPLTQDNDDTPQPDRTATAERMVSLKAEVEKVMKTTGAQQVVLMANSRGGHAVRNRTHNGGGDKTASHTELGSPSNQGVWATQAFGNLTGSHPPGRFSPRSTHRKTPPVTR